MTKKQTDANSILQAARRAADVPRPKEKSQPDLNVAAPPEKRVNVSLRAQTHKRLKLLSVQREMSVQDLAEELLTQALDQR